MLSPWSRTVRGFWHHGELVCVPCATKLLGEGCIARIEAGMSTGTASEWQPVWEAAYRFEVDESAASLGYEMASCCYEGEHGEQPCEAVDGPSGRYCASCGVETCMECGAELSTTVAEEQADEYVRAERGLPEGW